MTAYTTFLETFGEVKLREHLNLFTKAAKSLQRATQEPLTANRVDSYRTLISVVDGVSKKKQVFSQDLLSHLSTIWPAIETQTALLELHSLQLDMGRAEVMAAVAAAWTWLDVNLL